VYRYGTVPYLISSYKNYRAETENFKEAAARPQFHARYVTGVHDNLVKDVQKRIEHTCTEIQGTVRYVSVLEHTGTQKT
jgi:hypothetical protein